MMEQGMNGVAEVPGNVFLPFDREQPNWKESRNEDETHSGIYDVIHNVLLLELGSECGKQSGETHAER